MITYDRASLSIYSDATTAEAITRVIGLSPTSSHEKGDPTRLAKTGRDGAPDRSGEPRAHWVYDADEGAADQSDETGFRTLRVLIDVLAPRAEVLAQLRATCETIIWWSGDSDSSQGGFVLPVDMMQELAGLGCDLYGTTFLDDSEVNSRQ